MNTINTYLDRSDLGFLFLRLAIAVLLLFHGVAKILEPSSLGYIQHLLNEHNLPAFISYGVYIGEFIAPLMLLLGVYSRLGALIIAGNMLVVIILAHSTEILTLNAFGGWAIELQVFYMLAALTVAFIGSGKFAIRAD